MLYEDNSPEENVFVTNYFNFVLIFPNVNFQNINFMKGQNAMYMYMFLCSTNPSVSTVAKLMSGMELAQKNAREMGWAN